MGAGLPVACFDTVNNREYLGEGGSYADETTGQGLARAIIALTDVVLRERMGNINRQRATVFSWEKSAEKVEKIYHDILTR